MRTYLAYHCFNSATLTPNLRSTTGDFTQSTLSVSLARRSIKYRNRLFLLISFSLFFFLFLFKYQSLFCLSHCPLDDDLTQPASTVRLLRRQHDPGTATVNVPLPLRPLREALLSSTKITRRFLLLFSLLFFVLFFILWGFNAIWWSFL